jgi:hypothetical protein
MRTKLAPAMVALYLAPLVVVQAWAQVEQWREGFRPFVAPAKRVAFSWDMFAVRVERCTIKFDPPIAIGDRTLTSYASMRAPLEWDVVWDRVSDYETVARQLACEKNAVADMTCFTDRGPELHRRVSCEK